MLNKLIESIKKRKDSAIVLDNYELIDNFIKRNNDSFIVIYDIENYSFMDKTKFEHIDDSFIYIVFNKYKSWKLDKSGLCYIPLKNILFKKVNINNKIKEISKKYFCFTKILIRTLDDDELQYINDLINNKELDLLIDKYYNVVDIKKVIDNEIEKYFIVNNHEKKKNNSYENLNYFIKFNQIIIQILIIVFFIKYIFFY